MTGMLGIMGDDEMKVADENTIGQHKYRDVDWTIPTPPKSLDVLVALLMDIRLELKKLGQQRATGLAARALDKLISDNHAMRSSLGVQTSILNKIAKNTEKPTKKKPKLGPPDGMSIDELPILVRTHNCLKNEGIKTVEQIRRLTVRDLLAIPNFGRKSLMDLREAIGGLRED